MALGMTGLLAGCAAATPIARAEPVDVTNNGGARDVVEPAAGESSAAVEVDADVACGRGHVVEGIDVSRWQGSVDWAAVRASGRVFAFASVGHGVTVDARFGANWAAIRAAGLVRGAYQFMDPAQDARAQADQFVASVGALEPGDLPPVIDVEADGGASASVVLAAVRVWITRVRAALGREPMVYTGRWFWDERVRSEEFAALPLWVPGYAVPCPVPPRAWHEARFFQYSNRGSVAGVNGPVDLDRFFGTEEELRALGR